MSDKRQQQVAQLIAAIGAKFIAQVSSGKSLLTVTRADISTDFRRATIYFSCLPESYEQEALVFLRRKRSELKNFIKDHSRLNPLPQVDVRLDEGEKHRQRMEQLLHSSEKNQAN